jgi:hypothetical protein
MAINVDFAPPTCAVPDLRCARPLTHSGIAGVRAELGGLAATTGGQGARTTLLAERFPLAT